MSLQAELWQLRLPLHHEGGRRRAGDSAYHLGLLLWGFPLQHRLQTGNVLLSSYSQSHKEQLVDPRFLRNVCLSSLPVLTLGHGSAQRRLRPGHSLPWSGWQEDQRRLLAGPPPGWVHLEHGKAPLTRPRISAKPQRTLRLYLWLCAQIISHPNNLFEIMSKEPVKRERNLHNRVQSKSGSRHANTRRGVFPAVEDSLAWCPERFLCSSLH